MNQLGGGTSIYCPKCREITSCRVPNDLGVDRSRNYKIDNNSIESYFCRSRECLECGWLFETYEIWSQSPLLVTKEHCDSLASTVSELNNRIISLSELINKNIKNFEAQKPPIL